MCVTRVERCGREGEGELWLQLVRVTDETRLDEAQKQKENRNKGRGKKRNEE